MTATITVSLIFLLLCLGGFVLFNKVTLARNGEPPGDTRISVIIPARNEEKNLPSLLLSLKQQTVRPYEIIVCDDHSEDATGEVAAQYGVKVIKSPALPEDWTGKNWAVWNGFRQSSGDVLVFLDADVTLNERALETLIHTRSITGGAISVVPYHRTEKFYERLSLVLYLLGVLAFTSPFERKNRCKGLYGSCIVATRADYEKVSGHSSVSAELLDDLNLGKRFTAAGISVTNFIGYDHVSFRMYPGGLLGEIHGFGKGAILSTTNLSAATLVFVSLWVAGLLACGFGAPVFLIFRPTFAIPFIFGYLFYTLQFFYLLKYTGRYGAVMPVLHILSSAFFIFVMLYSVYRVVFIGSVSWKGREIRVGGRVA